MIKRLKNVFLALVFATIIWGAEIAWLVFLGVVIVKMVR